MERTAQTETVEDACPEKVEKLFGLLNEHEVAYHGAGLWEGWPLSTLRFSKLPS